jgi:hypothetical protein
VERHTDSSLPSRRDVNAPLREEDVDGVWRVVMSPRFYVPFGEEELIPQFWGLDMWNKGTNLETSGRDLIAKLVIRDRGEEVRHPGAFGVRRVDQIFRLTEYVRWEWICMEQVHEAREIGYYQPVICYIPIPWDWGKGTAIQWIKDVARETLGYSTRWVPMAPEFVDKFGADWSHPVQVKLDESSGELVFREVADVDGSAT